MSSETHDPELAALAKALTALAPAPGRLDRDRLLFCAGQASLRQRAWLWPSVAAGLALVAGALGLSQALHPAGQRVQCIVYQRVEPPVSPAALVAAKQSVPTEPLFSASDQSERQAEPLTYLRLQRLVLAWGVDALPNSRAATSAAGHDPLRDSEPDIFSRHHWLRR